MVKFTKNFRWYCLFVLLSFLPFLQLKAFGYSQNVIVSTLAGGNSGPGILDGTGSGARFDSIKGLSVDSLGNIYSADVGSNDDCEAIRKTTPAGVVTTLAGSCLPFPGGYADGTGSAAKFAFALSETAEDSLDNVYVADYSNCVIRKITQAGVVTTIAGVQQGNSTWCTESAVDGDRSTARLNGVTGMVFGPDGNLYITSWGGCTVRKVTMDGTVTTIAGVDGNCAEADGAGSQARFNNPSGIAIDSHNNFIICDESGETIRKMTLDGVVTTLAGEPGVSGSSDGVGSQAHFNIPSWPAIDSSDNIYITDYINDTIRKVTEAGVVTTIAGAAGQTGNTNGSGADARFNHPDGPAVDSVGNIYVADRRNNLLRKINTAPGVPVINSVASDNASVSIFFTASTLTGGSAVLYFTATSNPGNMSASSTASPILVSGLTNGQPYTFTVTATNAVGVSASSSVSGNVTPLDTTPPSVIFTSPSSNATVSSTITLSASSTDNVAVSSTAFYYGTYGSTFASSTLISSTSTASGTIYSVSWNTTSTTDGQKTIWVLATDTSNNTSTASTTITIDNAPPVLSLGSPSGNIASTASATLSLQTNETSTCRYSQTAGTPYASIPNAFTSTGGTSHSTLVSSLQEGVAYTYYVRCLDATGNPDTADYAISFAVLPSGSVSVPGGWAISVPPSVSPPASSSSPMATTTITTPTTIASPASSLRDSQLQLLALLQTKLASLEAQRSNSSSGSSFCAVSPVKLAARSDLTASFTRDLFYLMRGIEVERLQRFLIDQNTGLKAKALGQVGATGLFLNNTMNALSEYQKSVCISATGYFGQKTRTYVNGLR